MENIDKECGEEPSEELTKLLALNESQFPKRRYEPISPVWKQTFAATAAIFGCIAAGATSGYSAILIHQLKDSSTITLTQEVVSWIAAISTLPLGLANIISGVLMERYGRRMSHIILCVPFVAGWIIIALSNSLGTLLIGRFITGFCQGLSGPLAPVYIGETSSPNRRGFFLAGVTLAMALGIFISHLLGTFITWKWTAIICSSFPFICMVSILYCPETPSWLASKGRHIEAIESYKWLRGERAAKDFELRNLLLSQITAIKNTRVQTYAERIVNFRENLKRKEFYKPLLIMTGFFVMSQFCGINVIAFYTATIMQSVLSDGFDEYSAMLIADFSRVIMAGVTCVLSNRYGRRPLTIISGFTTMASLLTLALYLLLFNRRFIETNHSFVPLSLIVLYIVTSSLGIIPLPWVMVGEVFPVTARGLGSGISVCTTSIAFFVVIKIAPAMFYNLGMDGTFLFYGCVAFVGTCALFKFLPETRGRTLQQIEENFK